MRKIFTVGLIAILCLTLCCGFVLCGCDKKEDNTIRLCEVTHSLFYTPQYVAMALGYFEEEGLKVEISNGGGADNVMTALLTGETDVGLMGCEANIYVYLQCKKDYPKVVAQLTKRDGSFLVARTKIDNFGYQNIDGKTVLMGRKGGMPAMILQYVLNNNGYTNGKNITMDYTIQFSALAPAFTGGTGDFVPLFEPVASQLEVEGKGYIVSAIGHDSGEIPYTCYTATQEYINKNSDKLEKFLRAIWKGVDYVNNHTAKDLAKVVVPYFEGTSNDLLTRAIDNYKKYDMWMNTPITSKQGLERIQSIMQNAGELSTTVPYDVIVDNTVASKIG